MSRHCLTRIATGSLLLAIAVAGKSSVAQTRPATATTMTVTNSSGAGTTVASGTEVTLSAAVTAGSTHLTTGQVEFCDALAAHCTDIHLLGLAQLTSAGTATLKFRPGVGSHSYKAVFPGTNAYAGSASGVSALTVTGTPGPTATATTIAESGAWGNYALTATVTEAGQTTALTGSVSFLDSNHGNSVLGTETLGAAAAGVGWPNPKAINALGISTVLVTDLNGDGIADLVVNANPVVIYLGNADGTYTEAPAPPGFGPTAGPMVVADFNGDGIPDLAVAMYSSPAIAILLGKGDGTFQAPVQATLPSDGADTSQLVSADFNGDGIADLLVVDNYDSVLSILLGVGNGTFTLAATPSISVRPSGVALGDFNGDGKADFAVADSYSDNITILTGNGDGTFTTAGTVHSGLLGSEVGRLQIASADFNGDGKLDLGVAAGGTSGTSETVIVLTGNGDGTFNSSSQSQAATGSAITWVQVADFNQDGLPDVVLADASGNVSVLLNNGSGSLGAGIPVVTGLNVPNFLTVGVGDLNGDGYPDIAAGGYYNGTLGLYLTQPTETATAVTQLSLPAGLHQVEASYAGSSEYTTSVSAAIPLWGMPPATTTSLTATSGSTQVTSVAPGTVVTLTATVAAGGTPVTAGQVNFCDASAAFCTDVHILGTATVTSNGTAIFRFVPGAGTNSYKAVFIEDGYGSSSTSNLVSLTVGPAPSIVYTDTTVISSSGFPGDYSLTATVAGAGGTTPTTGSINFVDTSFGNATLGIASLGQSIYGIGWMISQTPALNDAPLAEVEGDFNGDGIPDLALLWNASMYGGPYSVTLYFGTGKGTFTTGPTSATTGVQTFASMIAGDFNGDGKTDLALMSPTSGYEGINVTVMLNNGDGTFAAPQTTQAYSSAPVGGDVVGGSMVTADFNGDGKMDLAMVGGLVASGEVTILMGNGDGTFTSLGTNYGSASSFNAIAAGDFNGDGIPDLVVADYFAPSGSLVLMGKGDGTFAALPTPIAIDTFAHSIAVGDFNGDGKLDLAFGYDGGVGVYLGSGDGTFAQATGSPFTGSGISLVAGDFNHDGKLDLAGIDTYGDEIDVQLGAGDGTFKEIVTTPSVNTQFSGNEIVAADFNSDGVPDLALVNGSSDSAQILVTEPTETASATVTGLAPVGAGTHNVDASYSGDSNYPASVSPTIALTAGLAPLVISPAGGTYAAGQLVTIAESVPGSTIYYAVYGGVHTVGFVPYAGPVLLNQDGSETIEAYATETGYQSSAAAYTTYTLSGTAPAGATVATVTVTPSVTTLTDAQSLTVTVAVSGGAGQPAPTGSATLSAGAWSGQQVLTSGSATFKVPANTLSAGNDVLTATYSGDATYAAAVGTAIVAVSPVASSSQAASAVSGGAADTSTISFFASNEYTGTLNLTCALTASPTGAQNLPTCSMSPTSVALAFGASGTSTLTVQTTAARTTASAHPLAAPFRWLGGGGATLAAVLLFVIPARRRRWASLFALLLGTFLLGTLGCGGGTNGGGGGGQTIPGTTAGNYTFTVTATDSANKQITTSTTVIITVQ
jgi:Bacterial Ig-like domain (group 3)/FG-GAP-like repeat/Chitobiase/beta-hexosaminidase C-terminal domain